MLNDQAIDYFERFVDAVDPRRGSGCYLLLGIPELVLINMIDWMIEKKNGDENV